MPATLTHPAPPHAVPPSRSRVVRALALAEGLRMLRHPALPAGVLLSLFALRSVEENTWSGARYTGYVAAVGGLLWGVSVAAAHAAARARTPLAEDAPVRHTDRVVGRLLGGSALVGVVAAVVLVGAVWLRVSGGLDLGDEPGRTEHAQYTLPELLQPVVLAVFAVAVGMAVGAHVRRTVEAVVVVSVLWFATCGLYWIFNAPQFQPLALVQVLPARVVVGPTSADPLSFPETWLLSRPGTYQDGWVRLVVSPEMAAWHDVYVVGLALVAAAFLFSGRTRRSLAGAGVGVATLAAIVQYGLLP